jgi:hypothetical protein
MRLPPLDGGAASAIEIGPLPSAPSARCAVRHPAQNLRLSEEPGPQINTRDDRIGGFEFRRDTVCPSIVGVVETAASPAIGTSGMQPPEDGQATKPALPQCGIRVDCVTVQQALRIARNQQPSDPAAQQIAAAKYLNGDVRVDEPHALGDGRCGRGAWQSNSHTNE